MLNRVYQRKTLFIVDKLIFSLINRVYLVIVILAHHSRTYHHLKNGKIQFSTEEGALSFEELIGLTQRPIKRPAATNKTSVVCYAGEQQVSLLWCLQKRSRKMNVDPDRESCKKKNSFTICFFGDTIILLANWSPDRRSCYFQSLIRKFQGVCRD